VNSDGKTPAAARSAGEHSQIFAKFQKKPWLVPKLRLWNVIALEASLLITGRMMDLQKLGNAPPQLKLINIPVNRSSLHWNPIRYPSLSL